MKRTVLYLLIFSLLLGMTACQTGPAPTDAPAPSQIPETSIQTEPSEPEAATDPSTEPEAPTEPSTAPEEPTEPEAPTDPSTEPQEPTAPSDPEDPTVPSETEEPSTPSEPDPPTEPSVELTEPEAPTERPTEPSEPEAPTAPPTEPTDPQEPTEAPSAPTDPQEPTMAPTEPTQPQRPTDPPTEPTQPDVPTQPEAPTAPTQCRHDYRIGTKEPSCTVAGSRTYTCKHCGDSYQEPIPMTDHRYTAATCTTPKSCSLCGATSGKALGHSYGTDHKCSRCGRTDPGYTPPCKHDYQLRTQKPTCTAPGSRTYTCKHCGDSYQEPIPMTGHSYTAATCTAPKTCSVCGTTSGKALGHSYGTDHKCSRCGRTDPGYAPPCSHQYRSTTKEATCTAIGIKTYTCTQCGDTYTETIPMTDHIYSPATCTQPQICSSCGNTTGTALGHSYSVTGETGSTCIDPGSRSYGCDRCDHSYTDTLPLTDHRYAAATCTAPMTCAVCAATTGDALGHSYRADHKCSRCGAQDPAYVTLTVTVRSDKGKAVPGVTVTFYVDDQPIGTSRTDSKGKATLDTAAVTGYQVILSDVPSTLEAKERYTFSNKMGNITLTTRKVVTPEDHSLAGYKAGSTMNDFTLTDTDGISYTLSEELKEKDLVILNFWYVACEPCKAEFPFFEAVYKRYADDVTLLTMSHFDSEDSIKALRQEKGVTFPMIREDIGFQQGFGLAMYPTTVFIGRSGKILKIHVGAYKSEQEFEDAIKQFL